MKAAVKNGWRSIAFVIRNLDAAQEPKEIAELLPAHLRLEDRVAREALVLPADPATDRLEAIRVALLVLHRLLQRVHENRLSRRGPEERPRLLAGIRAQQELHVVDGVEPVDDRRRLRTEVEAGVVALRDRQA